MVDGRLGVRQESARSLGLCKKVTTPRDQVRVFYYAPLLFAYSNCSISAGLDFYVAKVNEFTGTLVYTDAAKRSRPLGLCRNVIILRILPEGHTTRGCSVGRPLLQGYFAHKKLRPPLGSP